MSPGEDLVIKLDLNPITRIELGDLDHFPEEWSDGESANRAEFYTRRLSFDTSDGTVELVLYGAKELLERLELKPEATEEPVPVNEIDTGDEAPIPFGLFHPPGIRKV